MKRIECGPWTLVVCLSCVWGCGSTADDVGAAQGGAKILISAGPQQNCSRVAISQADTVPPGNTISSSDVGQSVSSGQDGATVKCRIAPNGGAFAVEGSIIQAAVALELRGVVEGGAGQVTLSTNTARTLYLGNGGTDTPCTLTVNDGRLGAGYIFADWTCPRLRDPDQPSLECQGSGTIFFENCAE